MGAGQRVKESSENTRSYSHMNVRRGKPRKNVHMLNLGRHKYFEKVFHKDSRYCEGKNVMNFFLQSVWEYEQEC
jgi:hypothetical protein